MEATFDSASWYPDGGSDFGFIHSLEVPQQDHGAGGLGERAERRLEIGPANTFVLAPAGWLHGRRFG
jgi:hypothetical protein